MVYRKTAFVENKQRETRSRIVSSARQLVEAGGWSNCNLTKTAKAAGVSTGSIYSHFDSITDLYITVFQEIANEEAAVIARIASGDGTPSHRFQVAVQTFSERALRGRVKAYAVMAEPVAQEVIAVRQGYHLEFIDTFETMIAEGVVLGEFRQQQPDVTAACVVGSISQSLLLSLALQTEPSKTDDATVVSQILAFCSHAVGMANITGAPPRNPDRAAHESRTP